MGSFLHFLVILLQAPISRCSCTIRYLLNITEFPPWVSSLPWKQFSLRIVTEATAMVHGIPTFSVVSRFGKIRACRRTRIRKGQTLQKDQRPTLVRNAQR